ARGPCKSPRPLASSRGIPPPFLPPRAAARSRIARSRGAPRASSKGGRALAECGLWATPSDSLSSGPMGDSAVLRPAPSGSGILAKTPLLHLLVYVNDRRLTGTAELVTPDKKLTATVYF